MRKDTLHSTLTHEINMLKADFKYYITMNHKIKHKLSEAIQSKNIDKIHYFSKLLQHNKSMIKAYTERLYETKHKRSQHQREKKFYTQRMYSLVVKQLNPMQKGVQSLHAVVEYANKYGQNDDYFQWANTDKTMIILDGGTALELGNCILFLIDNHIPYALFQEPDLYDMTTSVTFLASERIWDTKKYPNYEDYSKTNYPYLVNKDVWAKAVFNTTVEVADWFIKFREFIFSKHLAQ